ncbi:DUF4190 domain-containing protein [Gordonia crocea]|uniref:DUF4190 domain-containing protein n=1 Tax=Gordonia crocea TaxID=589162 RepID=A0A7I9UW40_9ACTN|nr:DUF4190 domain-containing protein [Gordonia crocea]GED96981.1 hypothetical protein nbrc107697_10200 [Gordonia crocea]
MTEPNDGTAGEGQFGASDADEWSSVNLNKPASPVPPTDPVPPEVPAPPSVPGTETGYVDPASSSTPPPGYPAPQSGYAQPGYVQPGYAQPGYPQPGYPVGQPDPYANAYGYPAYAAPGSGTDGLAVAALICGVLGLMCCIPGPIGLILGIMSLRNMNRDGVDGGSNRGMAIAGIVLGAITTLIIVAYVVMLIIGLAAGV